MKRAIKIVSIITLMLLISMAFMGTMSMASDATGVIDSITKGGNTPGQDKIQNLGNNIVNIITTIGIVVAVVVLLILGIKYMMGSAQEKAEYKKTMIPYLVGALLIFGASAIAKVVVSVTAGLTS